MKSKKLPRSIRKHIRKEKARIRREVFDIKEQEKLISELYVRFKQRQSPPPKKKKQLITLVRERD